MTTLLLRLKDEKAGEYRLSSLLAAGLVAKDVVVAVRLQPHDATLRTDQRRGRRGSENRRLAGIDLGSGPYLRLRCNCNVVSKECTTRGVNYITCSHLEGNQNLRSL